MWPFRKRIIDLREWNEDWRAGDLAECMVDPGGWIGLPSSIAAPQRERIYRVLGVSEALAMTGVLLIGLKLEGLPNARWQCTHFRKVRPSIEGCEFSFWFWLKSTLGDLAPAGR